MVKYSAEDFFADKQPDYSFEELDAPLYTCPPKNWNKRSADREEAVVLKVKTKFTFPDKEGLLETATKDLTEFLECYSTAGDDFTILTLFKHGMMWEEYEIVVDRQSCTIIASDTEGLRRGIYYIEDEMIRRGGTFLPIGTIRRRPHIKKRITRNFFTPHEANRELKDDKDYYSDNYLARLSHEGINGLWLFVRLRDFVPSDIVPEYGIGGEKQLKKLKSLAKKCARYGIGIYPLGVEPASTYANKILKEKHEDMLGAHFWNSANRAICPSTPKGSAYAEECMYKLFSLVPELAGFISITTGEAVAGCGGVGTPDEIDCPICKAAGLTKAMALAKTESLMQKGLKRAKPDGEFISWTYGARSWTDDMMLQHCSVRDKSIPLMNNFEDKGTCVQLGKERTTLDYWLSFPGPGHLFTLNALHSGGAPVYAKIQVCCSHELATVPYVPVPGILYDKYLALKEYDTEGVMYCWFFGNYPGLMNKAAGELAFLPFAESKEEFLKKTALLYTDAFSAEKLAKAWAIFEESYKKCPYNVIFAWYGPINDAVARPLHLLPIDMAVPSNWLLTQSTEGDRFGECIGMMHTPEEVLILLDEMRRTWLTGVKLLETIEIPREMLVLARAIFILIKSAYNMVKFYLKRNELGYMSGDSKEILKSMEQIIIEEIENSEAMKELCIEDRRLGYHSEAVGFKFFPEKLDWRINRLKETLKDEFLVVRQRLAQSLPPLKFFTGEEGRSYSLALGKKETFVFEDGTEDKDTSVSIKKTEESYIITIDTHHTDELIINAEFMMFVPYVPVRISADGSVTVYDPQGYFLTEKALKEETAKWHCTRANDVCTITLYKKDFGLEDGRVFRMAIRREGEKKSFWHIGKNEYIRLAYNGYKPDSKVFII